MSVKLRKAAEEARKTLDVLSAECPEHDSLMEKHEIAAVAAQLRDAMLEWDQDLDNFVESARRQR